MAWICCNAIKYEKTLKFWITSRKIVLSGSRNESGKANFQESNGFSAYWKSIRITETELHEQIHKNIYCSLSDVTNASSSLLWSCLKRAKFNSKLFHFLSIMPGIYKDISAMNRFFPLFSFSKFYSIYHEQRTKSLAF